jgi:hypothetical protein
MLYRHAKMQKRSCKKNEISQSIYDSKFAKRLANLVFYDEVDKYLVVFFFKQNIIKAQSI